MIITLILLLIVIIGVVRFDPKLDYIILGLNKVLVLWYNTDWKGSKRDYIILW